MREKKMATKLQFEVVKGIGRVDFDLLPRCGEREIFGHLYSWGS
jgi:hypothetical protein